MTKLKHIPTSDLINELFSRHGLKMRGFGCFYHFLQTLTRKWDCKASSGDPKTAVITTNFYFDDGSSLSVSEKRTDIVAFSEYRRSNMCDAVVRKNREVMTGGKF